jgi:pyruvate/2-oxoglutarate dehydrogenase complex dihydrolipoamide acyltransferase (E2) component
MMPALVTGLAAAPALWEEFIELVLYGLGVFILLLVLIIVKKVMRASAAAKVRNMGIPFGGDGLDLHRLGQEGKLTPEEVAAIRRAIGRQIAEREAALEAARKLPPVAEVALGGTVDQQPPPPAPRQAAPRPAPTAPPAAEPVPPALRALVDKSDFELDQMVDAGFIDRATVEQARQWRRDRGRP